MQTISNFSFLKDEFPIVFDIAQSADDSLYSDFRNNLLKIRRLDEKELVLAFGNYNISFSESSIFNAVIKTLEFDKVLPLNIRDLIYTFRTEGSKATQEVSGFVEERGIILFLAFKLAKSLYQSLFIQNKDLSNLKFHAPANLDSQAGFT